MRQVTLLINTEYEEPAHDYVRKNSFIREPSFVKLQTATVELINEPFRTKNGTTNEEGHLSE